MMRMTTLVFVCASIAGCSWGGDGGGTGGGGGVDAAVSQQPVCGDGVCAASEVSSCSADCGSGGGNTNPAGPVCGNGTCETGETSASCPNDCGGGGGSGSGGGSCPSNVQDCLFCALAGQMCPTGLDMTACTACLSGGGGGGGGTGDLLCTGGAPDGTCDAMENHQTCPSDCP